jgi:broad specificity phosphatase PhoE
MTKIIHLIRHGHHALLGTTLCGRMNGVDLDDLGRRQITRCCDAVRPPPMLIQSSPQRRTMHSAGILAERFGLAVEIVPALNEIDYGEWTGRSFVELEQDPRWLSWNARRETGRPPKGESMRTLQRRVVDHLEQLRRDRSADTVALVSHAEPIRAALLHYAGIGLGDFLSIVVDPASISTLSVDRNGIRIAEINQGVHA